MDGRKVLDKLSNMEISSWNYKSADKSVRHIGPMAQDFLFGVRTGLDDKHITTIDADGVALAAIKGLHEVVKEKEAKIEALESRDSAKDLMMAEQSDMIEGQRKLIDAMESRLSALKERMD